MRGIEPSGAQALDRTLMLMRDHVGDAASDARLLAELSRCRLLLVADRVNATSRQGQVALVSAALLCARTGAEVWILSDDVPLVGLHPPLASTRLTEGLTGIGADLVPGSAIGIWNHASSTRPDLCVLLGDTPADRVPNAELTVRISGDDWSGGLLPASERGTSWAAARAPLGAMAAAALVAGEAYKLVMRRLRDAARVPIGVFDSTFAPSPQATVRLAPIGTPCPTALGELDFISGGAITHATLYALSRIDLVNASARVIEAQTYDLANLNRYALLRRSNVTHGKARHLADLHLGGIRVEPITEDYDESLQLKLGNLAESVLVGVDRIPSRWLAQAHARGWLGVAGTEHYETLVSFHTTSTACAACLHHSDGGLDPRAPTVAFVSFWAGLWLAALYLRHRGGEPPPISEQAVRTVMLRPDLGYAISKMRVSRRSDCRLSCGA